jgi:hypothetical protein
VGVKLKRDEVGVIIKHKTRLVARGFLQREGIDFDDAFAPVARMEVRVLFLTKVTAQTAFSSVLLYVGADDEHMGTP